MQTTVTVNRTDFLAAMIAGWQGLGWNNGSYFAGGNAKEKKPVEHSYRYSKEAKTVCAWGALAKFYNAADSSSIHQNFEHSARNAGIKLFIADVSNEAGSKAKAIAAVTKHVNDNWPDDKTVTFEYDTYEQAAA